MSTLLEFHTFEVMDGATIESVSSEATGHPAEHAIAPLEPNFAWEADESSAQHTLVVDLGETRHADGLSYIHHETEDDSPSPDVSTVITVEKSHDATNWTSVNLSQNTDAGNDPSDVFDSSVLIKLRYFLNAGSDALETHTARYWRFTVQGVDGTTDYAPSDARISMCWLFRLRQLDYGGAWPFSETVVYPSDATELPFGKVHRTGYSVNPHTLFTRVWMVTTAAYTTLRTVMRECNGAHRPFVLTDVDGTRRLCKFASDEIKEELLDVGIYRITCEFVELPVVKKDKYH